jgi:hypothetical protein
VIGNTKHRYDDGGDRACPPLPPLRSGSDDDTVPVQVVSLFGRAQSGGVKSLLSVQIFLNLSPEPFLLFIVKDRKKILLNN